MRDVPKPKVATDTISANVSRAYRDSLTVGSQIVIGGIRLTGVLVPFAVLLGVPSLLSVLALRKILQRRASRRNALLGAGA